MVGELNSSDGYLAAGHERCYFFAAHPETNQRVSHIQRRVGIYGQESHVVLEFKKPEFRPRYTRCTESGLGDPARAAIILAAAANRNGVGLLAKVARHSTLTRWNGAVCT